MSDLQIESRNKDKVDDALKMVEQIYATGSMADEVYFKCLVSLAYEYLQNEDLNKALILINKPTPDYYKTTQYQQMEVDEMYKELVVMLSYKLIQLGVLNGSDKLYTPTQAGAQA